MRTIVLILAVLTTVPALAQGTRDLPGGIRVESDVAYLPTDRAEKADLYLPANSARAARRPAVVIIHGGGWTSGDKGRSREINIGTTLALHGYVALSINYILSNQGQVTWPRNLHDCKSAVRWLRQNADRLQIDPEHLGVIGGSAGGHLAMMVAVTGPKDGLDPKGPDAEVSCRVQCAVDLYGPIDLLKSRDIPMLGMTRLEAPQLYHAASPTSYLDRNDPPILIIHGTADKTVSLSQSETFAEALRAAGIENELVVVPEAPHTFDLQPQQRDLRPVVLGFFDRHLKPPSR